LNQGLPRIGKEQIHERQSSFFILAFLFISTPALAAGAEYPTRAIEYVVPAAAGGDTDMFARIIAPYVSKRFGHPVMVVNKPGGGTVVGAAYVLKQQKATATRCWPIFTPATQC